MCVHAVGPPLLSAGPANRQRIRPSTGARVTATIDKSNTKPKGIRASRMSPLITPKAAAETTFADLGVRDEIVQALTEEGVEHPFAIQELTLPLALTGDDLIGQARTGMGKTFAFGVPLLQRITTAGPDRPLSGIPRALIVVPTRELCLQVYGDLSTAAKYSDHRGRPKAVGGVHLRRPALRAADRVAARRRRRRGRHARAVARPGPAGTPAARRPVGAGARRGRRDARSGLPARHRTDSAPDPRRAAGDAVLGDHAGPDHHAGPHLHEPAHPHPGRGAALLGGARPHQAVRLPRARDG